MSDHMLRKALRHLAYRKPQFRKAVQSVLDIAVGDILYSNWGYDQTNIDFYQVLKRTAKQVTLRRLENRVVRGKGKPTEYVTPVANSFTGKPLRRKLNEYRGEVIIRIHNYSYAHPWDGQAKAQTGGAFGR